MPEAAAGSASISVWSALCERRRVCSGARAWWTVAKRNDIAPIVGYCYKWGHDLALYLHYLVRSFVPRHITTHTHLLCCWRRPTHKVAQIAGAALPRQRLERLWECAAHPDRVDEPRKTATRALHRRRPRLRRLRRQWNRQREREPLERRDGRLERRGGRAGPCRAERFWP